MSAGGQELLLGQLEKEVNLVFEHTGRLFAAAASNNGKTAPTAQLSKLKQVLRTSDRRFQEALDQLEDELHTAKLVMRRDLALLREESGFRKPSQVAHSMASHTAQASGDVPKNGRDSKAPEGDATGDVMMQDSESVTMEGAAENRVEGALTTSDPSNAAESKTEPNELDASLEIEGKAPETGLALDTQTQPANDNADAEPLAEEDKPPDTATFSNANDFDSLFGGPMSAGPVDAPGFDLGVNANDDFDFDAFASSLDNTNVDNDNISALLPGLEDYATQPGGADETDFDSIFNTLPDGEQADIPHRDSTFDDLGDLLDFNMEFDGGADGGGENTNDEIDFSTQ